MGQTSQTTGLEPSTRTPSQDNLGFQALPRVAWRFVNELVIDETHLTERHVWRIQEPIYNLHPCYNQSTHEQPIIKVNLS